MRAPHGLGLWAALIVAAVALVGAVASPDAAAQAGPCAGPRGLVAEKKIEQAKTAYTALAGTKSAPPCAAAELAVLETSAAVATAAAEAAAASKSCDGAQALVDAQLYEEAEDAFAKLASGDAPPPCAAEGLKTTKTTIKDERTRAEQAGDDADDAFDWLANWGKLALLVVAAIAIVGAVALRFGPLAGIGRRLTWWLSQPPLRHGLVRRAPRRVIRGLFAPVAWALATPIEIQPLKAPIGDDGKEDEEAGDAMTRTIAGMLPAVSARRSSSISVAIKPFGAESALKEVTDALGGTSQGKAAAAALAISRRLVPRNRLHLTGTVLASKARGKGLALEIVNDGGDVLDAVTLWETDLAPFLRSGSYADDPEEDRTVRLGTAGAVWVLFAILRERRVLSNKGWRQLLGTRSWESYARSLIAVAEAESRDDPTTTQAGYAHALDADPENMTALFNLGQGDVKSDDWRQAVDRLQRVDDELAARGPRAKVLWVIPLLLHSVNRDPFRYQVAYGLAYATYMKAEHEAAAARKRGDPDTDVEKALREGIASARQGLLPHVVALERALRALRRPGGRPTRDHDDLYAQLRRFEGPLLTLWGYLNAKRCRNDEADDATPNRWRLIKRLEGGKHAWVIQKFLPRYVSVGPKTTYNLASYYVEVEEPAEAWKKLEDSLALGFLASVAEKDEQLESLREAEPKRFKDLIARYRNELSGLGRYTAIGKRGADALEGARIETEAVLLERAHTRTQREGLARGRGVGYALIERWAHAADMGTFLKVEQVNLLDAAGVSTRDLLACMKPASLSKLVMAIEPKPTADLPEIDELRDWITQARLSPSKLSLE